MQDKLTSTPVVLYDIDALSPDTLETFGWQPSPEPDDLPTPAGVQWYRLSGHEAYALAYHPITHQLTIYEPGRTRVREALFRGLCNKLSYFRILLEMMELDGRSLRLHS